MVVELMPARWSALDPGEVLDVLVSRFQRATSVEDGIVEIPASGSECCIRLEFGVGAESSVITKIEPGPAFAEDAWSAAVQAVDEALLNGPDVIVRAVGFHSVPVTGAWRSGRTTLQIMPVPPEAPRPPAVMGDHPFVLEFAVRKSPHSMVNWKRRVHVGSRWAHFLNVVLVRRTFLLGPRSEQAWGIEVASDEPKTVWVQFPFYSLPEFRVEQEELSDISSFSKIQILDNETYYNQRGISGEDGFTIPVLMEDAISAYISLDKQAKLRFETAAHWLSTAHSVWHQSASLSFQALVSAIECACRRDERRRCDCCEACRQYDDAATSRFRGFLEKYGGSDRKAAGELYKVRSELTHGARLLRIDEGLSMSLDRRSMEERNHFEHLWQASRVALLNWLLAGSVLIE